MSTDKIYTRTGYSSPTERKTRKMKTNKQKELAFHFFSPSNPGGVLRPIP